MDRSHKTPVPTSLKEEVLYDEKEKPAAGPGGCSAAPLWVRPGGGLRFPPPAAPAVFSAPDPEPVRAVLVAVGDNLIHDVIYQQARQRAGGEIADRADFNSNRRFYRWTNDVAEYLEDMADRERQAEVGTVEELLDEIESENLYQVLVTVDGRTLKIVLLKMQGYSTKEIAPLVHLTTGAIYARLDHLRKKLRKIL